MLGKNARIEEIKPLKNMDFMSSPRGISPLSSAPAAFDSDDDSRLMQLVGAGDRAAFGTLMQRHLSRTVRLAARMLGGGEAQAEDVAQEAFVRVWRHAANWQDSATHGARFTTWLYRIVLNIVIDEKRKRVNVGIYEVAEPVDASLNAEGLMAQREASKRVRDAMGQLPDRQRAALVLCFFEGFSNREAADQLGVGVKALESLLVRARKSLRDMLKNEEMPS